MMLDLIISGGEVFDGTGTTPRESDIGILGDTIVDIGDLSQAETHCRINASGKYVTPGFIDVHSHSDVYLFIEPNAPSKLTQGITTEIVGQCGASGAPLVGEYNMPSDWRNKPIPFSWNSVAAYRQLIEDNPPAPNVVLLAGHNAIRAGVMGYAPRVATSSEVKSMKNLLEESMKQGACGMSTGLLYLPGKHSTAEEVNELAKVVAENNGIYASHIRSEGDALLESLDEMLEVGRQTEVTLQISHLKVSGRRNWHKIDAALEKIDRARSENMKIASDRYPYTAACTELDVLLPNWAAEGGKEVVLSRLRDKTSREKIRVQINNERDSDYWETVMVGSTLEERYCGRWLPEIANELGMEPVDVFLYLIENDELQTGGIFFGMNEENMWRILSQPYVMIGSDASLRALSGPLSKDHPHPRAYGTFPKFLRAAIEGKTVSLSEAIRKMTSLPAEHFNLKKRGKLAKDYKADIVVFDSRQIKDKSTYVKPHQLSEGIEDVIVNGVLTVKDSQSTGSCAGRFLTG